ncbi:NAD(P)H-binding protein [Corynebacterium aquatimens]|uniref:NAD(P)H-binding protein n=1 Tax=Corynebacterium TaxID=1716 RepID=UPI001F436D73|nr:MULTISPECIES: NAD(P)H-binding protein [Corynebacterium]QYH19724.1 NAD(P)H-binding protein [Corynebacterium aquatimens]UIZ93178.1 NAD(P)H-binding protein [Corynebacterium sp. CNCTC7651]
MTTPETDQLHVLVIGAGGNVSKHSVPMLIEAGHRVSALVRNPDYAQRLKDHGATVIVQDLTDLNTADWERLVTPFDVIVWSAGAGGGSAERTYDVDRDAAMKLIDALEMFDEVAPRLVMVSYAGATTNTAEDDGGSWYAYVESKKAVDKRLLESNLPYVILGPTKLTDESSNGINVLSSARDADSTTSRELVAQVIVEAVSRDELLTPNPFEFEDGTTPVTELP